jgi:hypothetical protein
MINKINQALLKLMNGTEIMSLSYEDIVFIEGKKVIRYGEIIDRLNTNEKIERLFREMVYQEYGTNDIKKIEKMEGF